MKGREQNVYINSLELKTKEAVATEMALQKDLKDKSDEYYCYYCEL